MLTFIILYVTLIVVYFVRVRVFSTEKPEPSLIAAAHKCAPILLLIYKLYTCEVSNDAHQTYSKLVMWGVIASVWGDFFLVWFKALFLPGVSSFAFAHIFYILAFGTSPLQPAISFPYILVFAVMTSLTLSNLKKPAMQVAVAVYIGIICIMGWRAHARHITESGVVSWYSFIGAAIFMVSDTAIATFRWIIPGKVTNSNLIIMVTYYAGQLLICISAIHPHWMDTDVTE